MTEEATIDNAAETNSDSTAGPNTHAFQTEVSQLLQLMIHSLYSDQDIFLRELISNASDALDKLRFEAVQDDSLLENDSELAIQIRYDQDAKTVTISDNGIGMSRDEVVENLGTIAKSGTKQFLANLTGEKQKDAQLIGQFGVGFYSSFMVASEVTVITRRAGSRGAVQWSSDGQGEYRLDEANKATRGTDIVLHLREDAEDYADGWKLRGLIRKYSDHIGFPIQMLQELTEEDRKEGKTADWEAVNQASALWQRPKADVSDEEYQAFYKHISHDFEDPIAWSHNRVEGSLEYKSLLYLPKRAPFDLFDRDSRQGLKLYVQRVFIMDDAEQLMPRYLRFVRGVIDSNDLPLNVSREILQSNKVLDKIRGGSVKKVLGLLADLAKGDDYAEFWGQFGRALKEGVIEDAANKEAVAKLLRFASTHHADDAQTVSLEDYIGRMAEGQEDIYYITAETHTAANNSPHLEIFKAKGIEVLLLSDPIDEWVVGHLTEFAGKTLKSAAQAGVDLSNIGSEEEKAAAASKQEEAEKSAKPVIDKLKSALGERVEDVRITTRLQDSPACIVAGEQGMSENLRRMLKEAGQPVPDSQPILEINPEHAIIGRLQNEENVDDWALLLLDQAVLAEGGHLADPADFVKRMNNLLL